MEKTDFTITIHSTTGAYLFDMTIKKEWSEKNVTKKIKQAVKEFEKFKKKWNV